MNAFDTVINVNPALQPVGALNPDVARRAIRSRVFAQGTAIARRKSGKMLRRIFGPTSLNAFLSVVLFVCRMAFAGWMIAEGVMSVLADGFSLIPAAMIALGAVVAIGIGTRVAAGIAAVTAGFVALTALSEGLAPGMDGLIAGASAFIAFVGPGRFSIDAKLRRNIFRAVRRRQMTKLLENRFSYRAFEYAHIG